MIADLLKVTRIEKRDMWVYLSNVLLQIQTFTYFISYTFLVNFVLHLNSPGTRVTKIKRKREDILFFFKVNEWRIPEKKKKRKSEYIKRVLTFWLNHLNIKDRNTYEMSSR